MSRRKAGMLGEHHELRNLYSVGFLLDRRSKLRGVCIFLVDFSYQLTKTYKVTSGIVLFIGV